MYYCVSRYYCPFLGRWLTADSDQYIDSSLVCGLNLFAYCGNDPVNSLDPEGNFAIVSFIIMGLFLGAMLGFADAAYMDYKEDNIPFNGSALDYIGKVLGGALIGGALSAFPWAGAGLVAGITGLFSTGIGMGLQNAWEGKDYTLGQISIASLANGLMSAVAAGLFEAIPIKGINRGRGSWKAIGNMIKRKFFNGTIWRVSFKTFCKGLGYNMMSSLIGTALSGITDSTFDEFYIFHLF